MMLYEGAEECVAPSPDHDYIQSFSQRKTMATTSTQTDMRGEDIDDLEDRAAICTPKPGIFSVIKSGAESMKYWRNDKSVEKKKWEGKFRPGRKRKLPIFFEFIMTLVRLKMDIPFLLLSDLFSVSTSKVTEITTTWICYLHQTLVPSLLIWPSQAQVRARMPMEFRQHFPRTRVVIDCTEFYIDRPRNKTEQFQTYSTYKSHNTYKCLVGVNPNGSFTFVSDLWSGNVSDKYITHKSGLIDLIEEGDQVMADRGFRIEDLLLMSNASLVAPPFTRQYQVGKGKSKRLNVKEIRKTRQIAKLRIHVERAIQRMKTWRVLKHQIPAHLQNMTSMITKILAALCNLKGPLFYSPDEQHLRSNKSIKKKPTVIQSRQSKIEE